MAGFCIFGRVQGSRIQSRLLLLLPFLRCLFLRKVLEDVAGVLGGLGQLLLLLARPSACLRRAVDGSGDSDRSGSDGAGHSWRGLAVRLYRVRATCGGLW